MKPEATENSLEKRMTYLAADLLQDDLPTGFDLVLLFDVGSFSEILFRRIYDILNLNGHVEWIKSTASRNAP